MTEATWIVDADRIQLRLSTGEMAQPTAMEIFQVAFGRSSLWRGMPVSNPIDDLGDVTFSREAARPLLRLREEGDRIVADLGIATDAGFAFVEREADQVVSSHRWYPIDRGQLANATTWLRASGIGTGQALTLGALVALRLRGDIPFALLDEVTFTSSSPGRGDSGPLSIPGLAVPLYPYQRDGVHFLRLVADQGVGCILGDEMGLGKTAQVIALLQIEKNAGRGQSLVVAPATLLENWKRELRLFAPQLTVVVHAGSERAGISSKLRNADVLLVSYDTAIRDEEMLSSITWNIVALDEAQNIKNPDAQRTVAAKRLPRRVSIAVTGTPLENRLEDLWSLADFALPGLLGELSAFREEFSGDVFDAARLAPIVAPFLLRRHVTDVAQDLPERIEVPQPLRMSLALAEAYEGLRKATLAEYGAIGALVATTRLRMLCAHPLLVGPWNAADPAHDMPKYVRTMEILEEVFSNGEKALVFSTYQGIADVFMSDMPRRFPEGFFRHIDGRVAVRDRQTIVDEFFSFGGYGALFLNPKAAGTGLNITAANHVIHYNPEWNPAVTAQASARAYRRKQTRPVTIHHLFFVNTVEEVVRDVALFKQALAGQAVTGHDGSVDPVAIARALQISPLAPGQEFEP